MAIFSHWGTYLPDFLPGLKITLELTASALAIGLPLGVLLALGCMSKSFPVRYFFIAIVEIGRGAPGLIVLYLVYYGLPQIHLVWSSFISATLGLSLSAGAYTAEIFRAGINAVPAGQREASRALGLSSSKEFRLIVLPQAIKIVIPALVGFSILLYQGTSLAFAIAVPELLSHAYQEATITYQFTATLTLAGAIYAVISLGAVSLLRFRWPTSTSSVGHPTDA